MKATKLISIVGLSLVLVVSILILPSCGKGEEPVVEEPTVEEAAEEEPEVEEEAEEPPIEEEKPFEGQTIPETCLPGRLAGSIRSGGPQ